MGPKETTGFDAERDAASYNEAAPTYNEYIELLRDQRETIGYRWNNLVFRIAVRVADQPLHPRPQRRQYVVRVVG